MEHIIGTRRDGILDELIVNRHFLYSLVPIIGIPQIGHMVLMMGIILLIVIFPMIRNIVVIEFEQNFGNPGIWALGIMSIIVALANTVCTLYSMWYASKCEDADSYMRIILVQISYLVLWIIWSYSLFFSRTERGISLFVAIMWMLVAVYQSYIHWRLVPGISVYAGVVLVWPMYAAYLSYAYSRNTWISTI